LLLLVVGFWFAKEWCEIAYDHKLGCIFIHASLGVGQKCKAVGSGVRQGIRRPLDNLLNLESCRTEVIYHLVRSKPLFVTLTKVGPSGRVVKIHSIGEGAP